ncbi:hypothetical protein AGLY_002288 [Aphis glycines]|uniref:Uncharacterized protein n=1 Tax=Aphis glycines TaxID=307491 RepID=A0A6G0U2Z3_APHGL|nr:hypothetical protein AGLY_002288 [Aphis glycines]
MTEKGQHRFVEIDDYHTFLAFISKIKKYSIKILENLIKSSSLVSFIVIKKFKKCIAFKVQILRTFTKFFIVASAWKLILGSAYIKYLFIAGSTTFELLLIDVTIDPNTTFFLAKYCWFISPSIGSFIVRRRKTCQWSIYENVLNKKKKNTFVSEKNLCNYNNLIVFLRFENPLTQI